MRVPAGEAELAGLQHRGQHGLHQRLTGLEVLAADRARCGRWRTGAAPACRRRGSVRRWRTARPRAAPRRRRASTGRSGRRWRRSPSRTISMSMCAGPGSMKISVLAHQIITSRSTCFSSRNRLMSSRIASSIARLLMSPLVCSPSRLRAYLRSNAALIGRMSRSVSEIASMCLPAVEHAGAGGGDVGVVGEHVPRAPHDVLERGERHEVLDQRAAVLGALAEPDRAHLREAADRQAHAALDELDAGDEGGGDRAEADREHAEAARGGGDSWGRRCRHGATG